MAVVTAVAVVVPGALTGRAPSAVAGGRRPAGPPVTFAIVGLWSVLLGFGRRAVEPADSPGRSG